MNTIRDGGLGCDREAPLKRRKWQYTCRNLGMSSLKEAGVYHEA
jgi:hypothetical protein